jgi:AraC family transcriptional regulator of adaptative response/methylated-DNA-[protein]-cysteine methyltransferase
MSPQAARCRGRGERISVAIEACWLGRVLVAATARGVCAILLGDDPDQLRGDLQRRFSEATLVAGSQKFKRLVARVLRKVESPASSAHLPLDGRGTAFQQQVWQALAAIPAGSTTNYSALAAKLGCPRSVRAVASAVAANPLAVAIPCHRVVRKSGGLAGYRWGVRRKSRLLARERQPSFSIGTE